MDVEVKTLPYAIEFKFSSVARNICRIKLVLEVMMRNGGERRRGGWIELNKTQHV